MPKPEQLERGAQLRLDRARTLARLREGKLSVREALEAEPLQGVTMEKFGRSIPVRRPRDNGSRARRALGTTITRVFHATVINPSRTVAELTERQREFLAQHTTDYTV